MNEKHHSVIQQRTVHFLDEQVVKARLSNRQGLNKKRIRKWMK